MFFGNANSMIVNLAYVLFCCASVLYALPIDDEDNVLWFLQKLEKTPPEVFAGYESVSSAVQDFQKSAGLVETESNGPATGLTYRIRKYPINVKDVEKMSQEFAKAMMIWSDIAELHFKEDTMGRMDIGIHFDMATEEDENKPSSHSFIPRYGGTEKVEKKEKETTDKEIEPIHAPDICADSSLDTITRTNDGSTYAFKGDFYWKINYNVTADGYPRKIKEDWGGLEGDLDASFTGLGGKTFFFKDRRYWRFTNKQMDSGYPKLISEGFEGIPDDLDAAITWGRNGKPYFFKGGQYWRYDAGENPSVKDAYPMSIGEWKGLPLKGIDAAVLWDNRASYFFKEGYYYRFDDVTSEVSKQYNYPASTGVEWFSCGHRH